MALNIKGMTALYFPHRAQLVPHPVAAVVQNTRKEHAYLGFCERTPSILYLFSIVGNIHQFKLL